MSANKWMIGSGRDFSTQIVRGVLKIIRPGIFKVMLINKDDMTVTDCIQSTKVLDTSTLIYAENSNLCCQTVGSPMR